MSDESLVKVNKYLQWLVVHLDDASKDDPYKIIIESLLGIRKNSFEVAIPYPIGKRGPHILTGELKYPEHMNTLRKYGIVIDIGKGRLGIDERFRTILRTKKYQWVGLLTKQKRSDLENRLKKSSLDKHVIDAILDHLDNKKPITHLWKKIPKRPDDDRIPHSLSTFR